MKENQSNEAIKDLNKTLKIFQMNIEYDAEDANSYYLLANTLVKLGYLKKEETYFKEALQNYNKAIELSPQNPIYLGSRCELYVYIQENDLAAKDLSTLKQLPENDDRMTAKYVKNLVRKFENKITTYTEPFEELVEKDSTIVPLGQADEPN